MKQHKVGIIMNGVTGRMGTNQHLMRSIVEKLSDEDLDAVANYIASLK